MSYPDYSKAERVADGAVHIAGVITAITGVSLLFAMWALRMDGGDAGLDHRLFRHAPADADGLGGLSSLCPYHRATDPAPP